MAVIYKYPIPRVSEPFELKIKGFCEVVNAGVDGNGQPCIWALVTPDNLEETWKFRIVATGESFDTSQWSHLKTFMQGPLVWHLLRPVDYWQEKAAPPVSISSLVYIVATKRADKSLPGVEKICDHRIYFTYDDAEEARQILLPDDVRESYGVFSAYVTIQQEVTCEVPF